MAAQRLVVHRRWGSDIPVLDHAEGVYLYDKEGKRYIDGSGGSSVVINIGHGNKEIADALYKQALKAAFSPAHVFANEPAEQLGEMVAAMAPGTLKDNCRVWFTCTGTDAVDDAVRLARQYAVVRGDSSRQLVIGRWEGFHGNNIAVAGFSGHTYRRTTFMPMYINSPHIPPAYCYRCPFEKTYPACDLFCARYLEKEIRQQGAENVLAFIAEPVVGAALGAVPAPDGYFQIIREICDKYGVLFIADEVMTAWGRTGAMWGIEHWGVTPDIIATAKGISSGYTPLAAVLAKEEIWAELEKNNSPFRAGHTFNSNPRLLRLRHRCPDHSAEAEPGGALEGNGGLLPGAHADVARARHRGRCARARADVGLRAGQGQKDQGAVCAIHEDEQPAGAGDAQARAGQFLLHGLC